VNRRSESGPLSVNVAIKRPYREYAFNKSAINAHKNRNNVPYLNDLLVIAKYSYACA
jgi:hypothetical protein